MAHGKESKYPAGNRKKASLGKPLLRLAAVCGILLFILSGGFFFLGVCTGRGSAPVQFDTMGIDRIIAELGSEKSRSVKGGDLSETGIDAGRSTELVFYEDLKKSRRKESIKNNIENGNKAAENLPEASEKKSSAGEDNLPDVHDDAGKKFSLQAAAFLNPEDADRLVDTLLAKGYRAYSITEKDNSDRVFHKVRVGYYAEREDTVQDLERLKNDKMSAFIVRR